MEARKEITIKISEMSSEVGLEIVYAGGGEFVIDSVSVLRPGLQLAGFFKFFHAHSVIVIGLSEYEYLREFDEEERSRRITALFENSSIPCVIFTRDLPVLPAFIDCARRYNVPIMRSSGETFSLVSNLSVYFNEKFAPMTSMHGVMLDVSGVGVLIIGHSGVGKSEIAIELIKRGHRLCSDDHVIITKIGNKLIASSPENIRHFMEIRGIGIINVRNMYGSGAVIDEKEIDLVIELKDWNSSGDVERVGNKSDYMEILGKKVEKNAVPVSPGRNVAVIVEVAARNLRLKRMGYDAAQDLIERVYGV